MYRRPPEGWENSCLPSRFGSSCLKEHLLPVTIRLCSSDLRTGEIGRLGLLNGSRRAFIAFRRKAEPV